MYYKVYFILAHKNPEQIKDLISLLDDGKSIFFIHVDKKIDIRIFKGIIQIKNSIFIKKRESGSWGRFGIVQATLNGMKEIQSYMQSEFMGSGYHCILLSGEDLPLKSNDYLNNFLEKNQDNSYINYWKLPYVKWWNGGFFRFESLYFFDYNKCPKSHYWLNKIIRKIKFNFLLPINKIRKHYPNIELYGSSQWMIFSQNLLKSIVKESNDEQFKKHFKYVLLPDELYIITLVQYFLNMEVAAIKNLPTHLIRFIGNNPNPQYLNIKDVENGNAETMLFARKFNNQINGDTISYVTKMISQ